MPWFSVDDGFADHPKVLQCSLAAIGLWCKAGAWCSKHLTDGAVPLTTVRVLGGTPKLTAELVTAGLWTEEGKGFRFHEWSKRNPTRADVEKKREADAKRKRGGTDSDANPRGAEPDSNATRNGVAEDSAPHADARVRPRGRTPLPSPPLPAEETHTHTARERLRLAVQRQAPGIEVADAAAEVLHTEAGLKRWDAEAHRGDLAWIGLEPDADLGKVIAALAADPWVKEHPALATPKHVRKHWPRYVEGPRAHTKRTGPAAVSTDDEWAAATSAQEARQP